MTRISPVPLLLDLFIIRGVTDGEDHDDSEDDGNSSEQYGENVDSEANFDEDDDDVDDIMILRTVSDPADMRQQLSTVVAVLGLLAGNTHRRRELSIRKQPMRRNSPVPARRHLLQP